MSWMVQFFHIKNVSSRRGVPSQRLNMASAGTPKILMPKAYSSNIIGSSKVGGVGR